MQWSDQKPYIKSFFLIFCFYLNFNVHSLLWYCGHFSKTDLLIVCFVEWFFCWKTNALRSHIHTPLNTNSTIHYNWSSDMVMTIMYTPTQLVALSYNEPPLKMFPGQLILFIQYCQWKPENAFLCNFYFIHIFLSRAAMPA